MKTIKPFNKMPAAFYTLNAKKQRILNLNPLKLQEAATTNEIAKKVAELESDYAEYTQAENERGMKRIESKILALGCYNAEAITWNWTKKYDSFWAI